MSAALTEAARGVYVIAPTPFTDDGAVDVASIDRMTDAYLGAGAAGMTILGVMGEAPKLDAREALAVCAAVLRGVDGRVPVIVGVSAAGYAPMRALAQGAMDLGAAGVMIAPAAGLRGDDAVVAWLEGAAAAVAPAPWVLQDYPQLTTVTLTVPMIARLAADPRLVMLKAEDWPGLDKITALRRAEAAGARRLAILVGNGGLFLPHELERGADGAMTGFAYPEMLVAVCRLVAEGRSEAAHDLYDLHLPLVRFEQQPGLGLAVRKHVLRRRGALTSATLRAPAPRLSPETIAEVERLMGRLERRLAERPTT